jgi:hypothetical protein
VDYFETFAPCTQLSSFRLILAISIAYNLELTHMDVQTAFLNSDLKEELYIQLPEGAVTEDGHYMAKLKKSLYGLKQAGHDWHSTSEDFILSYDNRLRRSSVEPCLYYFINEDIKIFILTQVDDYIVACNTKNWVLNFITAFNSKYSVNVLGKLSHFMQMEITFEHNRVTLSQQRTIEDLAATFDLTDCKPKTKTPMSETLDLQKLDTCDSTLPYRSLLGSLLWLARGTRPDISYSVSYLSQFSNCCSEEHFSALRRVLKYLIATKEHKLVLPKIKTDQLEITAYSDSDWAGDKLDRKSYTGPV